MILHHETVIDGAIMYISIKMLRSLLFTDIFHIIVKTGTFNFIFLSEKRWKKSYIFDLYDFLSIRTLRIALNNHVILLLLSCRIIEELTDTLWFIVYYLSGTALLSTPTFCLTWVFMGSAMCSSIFILMAWGSIERHIFIFYPN